MNPEYMSNLTLRQLNEIVQRFGGDIAAMRFLRGELKIVNSACPWEERNGIIRFSITSDETTRSEWIDRLKEKEFTLSPEAEKKILSEGYLPEGGIVLDIAVVRAKRFDPEGPIEIKEAGTTWLSSLSKEHRTTENILDHARQAYGLKTTGNVIPCMMREKIPDIDITKMGFSHIVVLEEPWRRFSTSTWYIGQGGLDYHSEPFKKNWSDTYGFAFVEKWTRLEDEVSLSEKLGLV